MKRAAKGAAASASGTAAGMLLPGAGTVISTLRHLHDRHVAKGLADEIYALIQEFDDNATPEMVALATYAWGRMLRLADQETKKAIPILANLNGVKRAAHKIAKFRAGTLGVEREENAMELRRYAQGRISGQNRRDEEFAAGIVAALVGPDNAGYVLSHKTSGTARLVTALGV